ncbi:MAG TPA: DUF465 domain-containing protein [Rhizobiales bacterium]|nr:DUF465 domain-containing protein [Hyphomicrobiales bacterium]
MTHTPHELSEEFPADIEIMHKLKMENAHFSKLHDEYHEVNREIHRIEIEEEAASDAVTEEMKKQRLLLKDEIYQMIVEAKS